VETALTMKTLPYDAWIEDALRGVIRRALLATAEEGPVGDHHFYITFATNAPGVELAPELRARYPDEMTIVLQHQFWDLVVDDDDFAVTLRFQGRSSRVSVPFTAITAFGDPSVNFGLQLRGGPALPGPGDLPRLSGSAQPDRTPPALDAGGNGGGEAKVITLDTFRKK
jgi:hypothetical protein